MVHQTHWKVERTVYFSILTTGVRRSSVCFFGSKERMAVIVRTNMEDTIMISPQHNPIVNQSLHKYVQ